MPHVIIKLRVGSTNAQKTSLADAVARTLVAEAGCTIDAVSVSIEDVQPEHWTATVYEPEIMAKPEIIYKQPGYRPQSV